MDVVVDADGRVAASFYNTDRPAESWLVDARLAAAAPDLLDALRNALDLLSKARPHMTDTVDRVAYDFAIVCAQNAINKAGAQP